MIFRESKISSEFHRWRQAEMDELVEDYLLSLAEDNKIKPSELAKIYGFKDLRYMIYRFKTEVETIWREHESNN